MFMHLGTNTSSKSITSEGVQLEGIKEDPTENVPEKSKRKEICKIEELKRNVQDLLEDLKQALNDDFGAENE